MEGLVKGFTFGARNHRARSGRRMVAGESVLASDDARRCAEMVNRDKHSVLADRSVEGFRKVEDWCRRGEGKGNSGVG